jgi:hypothetical protein
MERECANGGVIRAPRRLEIPRVDPYECVIRRGRAAGMGKGVATHVNHADARTGGLVQVERTPDKGVSTDVELPGWAELPMPTLPPLSKMADWWMTQAAVNLATKLAVAVPSAVMFEQEVAKGPMVEAFRRAWLVAGVGLGV